MKNFQAFIVVTLALIFSTPAVTQTVATGTPAFGSLTSGPDVTNLGNLNVHYNMPIFSKAGRGIPFSYSLGYDTSIWTPTTSGGLTTWTPVGNWGWVGQTQVQTGYAYYTTLQRFCQTSQRQAIPYVVYTFHSYYDKFGISHPFFAQTYENPCYESQSKLTANAAATDGSGYSFAVNYASVTVTARNGATIHPPSQQGPAPGSVTDANGNQVSTNGSGVFTDTLGTTALAITGSGTAAGGPSVYTYTDTTGTARFVKVYYTTFTVQTNFGCPNIHEYGPQSVDLVTSIKYPDNTLYQYTYEPTNGHAGSVTGRIAQVTLPTGGTISYKYEPASSLSPPTPGTTGANYINCADGSATAVTRTTTDGTTAYSRAVSGSASTTSVTPPDTNMTVLNFQSFATNFYETGRTNYSGSSTVVSWISTCYNGATSCNTAISGQIARVTAYRGLANNYESKTDTFYNTSGLPTDIYEYDFGAAANTVGPLLRHTATAYATNLGNIVDHPTSVTVFDGASPPNQVAQSTFTYDTGTALTATSGVPMHVAVGSVRGNPTNISTWLNTNNSYLTTTNWFDDTGNLIQTQDPGGHTSTFAYSSAYADAYLTQATLPNTGVAHIVSTNYDINTGLATSTTDQNNQITTYQYDTMLRLTSTTLTSDPNGNHPVTSFAYPDANTVQQTQTIDTSHNTVSYAYLDGYGRTKQTRSVDPQGDVFADITYDNMGRVSTVSNPYRSTSDPTYGITSTQYDALGRAILVNKPDGSHTAASYPGNATTSCDEASHCRTSYMDALGRLTQVAEQNPAGTGPSYGTYYSYDALNNLLSVNQQGDGTGTARNRTFAYDSLSRMTQAVAPESGTTNYSYDLDGNLATRTDARNITTTYSYDALDRLKKKTYSDGTIESDFYYDEVTLGIGRLTSVGTYTTNGWTTNQNFFYDALGRLTTQRDYCIPFAYTCYYTTTAEYNLGGGMTSLTYPSGRKVTNGFDTVGRVNQVTFTSFNGTAVNYPYWTVNSFDAAGNPNARTYGNGLSEALNLNKRLQPSSIGVNSGSTALLNRNFSYGANQNNGNVTSISDVLNSNKTQTFTYDYLNRLATAAESGSAGFGQTFSYDPWGNLTQQHADKGTNMPNFSQAVNANNQMVGYCYDAVGNVTSFSTPCGSQTYYYDAENRQTNNTSGTYYTYDANGQRQRKASGSNYTEYVYFGGQAIAELNQSGDWTDYIYAGGQRFAKADNFENSLAMFGTNCSNCGNQYTIGSLPNAGGYSGYVIRSGDVLRLRQLQATGSQGGIMLGFSDGTSANWLVSDQDGQLINSDTVTGSWHYRTIALSQFAGKTLSSFSLVMDVRTLGGNWQLYVADLVITSTDGTVMSFYNGSSTAPGIGFTNSSGVTNLSSFINHRTGDVGPVPYWSTTYYHGDHLGSARMMTSAGGWPVWQATFLPFGYEYSAATTPNHYKFTGDEQDPETGNSHTLYRDLSPIMARWMTPDPYMGSMDIGNPQSLNRYAYVLNNPMRFTDPDGRECVWDDGSYDSADDPSTGSATSCQGAGGTWIDPQAFATFGLPDWQPTIPNDPNQAALADLANSLNTSTSVTVTASPLLQPVPYDPVTAANYRCSQPGAVCISAAPPDIIIAAPTPLALPKIEFVQSLVNLVGCVATFGAIDPGPIEPQPTDSLPVRGTRLVGYRGNRPRVLNPNGSGNAQMVDMAAGIAVIAQTDVICAINKNNQPDR